jgi:hypothetical protein
MRRRWGVVAGVAVAVLIAAPAAAARVVSWDPMDHPSVSGRTQIFYGVDAAGPNDVWAIGYSWGVVGGALEFRTLAQHFDGSTWTRVPTPDVETAPAKDLLFDVDAVATDDVWAAGRSATAPSNPSGKPLVLHWDGSAWSIHALPAVSAGSSFSAIAADADSVWAVGEKYNPQSGYYQPLVMRREGGSWTEIAFPATTGCRAAPDKTFWRYSPGGVTIRENGDVYVSGACSSEIGERAVLGLYRNGRWRSAFDPTTLPGTSHLNDVDAKPGRAVLAVGDVGVNPLVLRGGGISFTPEPAPTVGTGTSLNAVAAGGPSYAVGTATGSDAFARPAALQRAGGVWRSEPVSTEYGNPFGVTYDPTGRAFGVGVSVTDDFGLILGRNTTP